MTRNLALACLLLALLVLLTHFEGLKELAERRPSVTWDGGRIGFALEEDEATKALPEVSAPPLASTP